GPLRVGVVGLGAGTLAAYGRTGDVFRFYDINSDVVELARSEFTFLKDSRAKVEVALGDARLSLEREPAQNFDVLALDAFSSDAIPVHLLTVEAFKTYLRHLKPDGVLAVHISNRYLDLVPVVQQAARHLSLEVRSEEHTSELQSPCNLVCRLLLEKKKIEHRLHVGVPGAPGGHQLLGIVLRSLPRRASHSGDGVSPVRSPVRGVSRCCLRRRRAQR